MVAAVPSLAPSTFHRTAVVFAVLVILAVAAYWRLLNLGSPGLWLDEILGVRGAGPEHGPIYYAVMRATTRELPNEGLTRLPFALAGLASVVVAFMAGRTASGPWLGIGAASAVAASPIHIYYSREARPYALLLLCGFVGLYALTRASRTERWLPWMSLLAAACVLALFTSANGVAMVAGLLTAAVWILPSKWRLALAWLALLVVTGCACWYIATVYYPSPEGTLGTLPSAMAISQAAAPLLGPMISGHREMSPVPVAAWLGLVLAAVGAITIGLFSPRLAFALLSAAVVGFALPVALMLWVQHGISVRYALAAFPALAVLTAGPLALVDRINRPWTREPQWLVISAALLLFVLGDAHAMARRAAYREKADWRRVTEIVLDRSRPGDTVIVSNDWSEICLTYYMPKGESARKIVNVHESLEDAKRVAAVAQRALLVSAGTHFTSYAVPRWMDVSLPKVWQGPREDLQVSFYPDRATYLETAITLKEVETDENRLATMLRSRIDMTINARDYLLDGWHDRETFGRDVPYRWADGRATFYVPAVRRMPSELVTRVRPHPNAGQGATFDVRANGVSLARTILEGDWQDVHVRIPDGYLEKGANVLEFFTVVTQPADAAGPAIAVQAIEVR
jgi:hypothetical protein